MLEQLDVETDQAGPSGRPDVPTDRASGREDDVPHGLPEAATGPGRPDEDVVPTGARCVCCGEGMAREVLPRFSRGYGVVVLIAGLLLSLFMSLLLGLPMVVIGAYMAAASRPVWTCRACGAVVDRTGT